MLQKIFFLSLFTLASSFSLNAQNVDLYPVRVQRSFLANCGNFIPSTNQKFIDKQVKLSLDLKGKEYKISISRRLKNGSYNKAYEVKYIKILSKGENESQFFSYGKGIFYTSDAYFEKFNDEVIDFNIYTDKKPFGWYDEKMVLFILRMDNKEIVLYIPLKDFEQQNIEI